MKLAGYVAQDQQGNGIEGLIPLTGLTVLFGKNASGKTAFLESLASILDPKFEWIGRRARTGDTNFAFGTLYLSGDWDGDDWVWLRNVMADQDSETASNSVEPVANVWEWPAYGQRSTFVREAAQHFADSSDPDSAQTLAKILDLLTKDMLVTYLPFPHGPVDAVIDTAMLDDDTRSWILESSRLLGDSSLAPSLVEIGASPQRYVRLMGLGFLDEEIFDDHALHKPTLLNFSAGVVDAEAMLAATIFGRRAAKIYDESDWLSPTEDGRYVTNPNAITAAAKVEEILQAGPLPAFILEQGLPEIRIPTPELWAWSGRVNLGLRTAEDRFLDIRQTSAATSRWLEILSVLAVDTLLRADLKNDESLHWVHGLPEVSDRIPRKIGGRVLLLDEPELHLHPVAQQQVSDWLTQTATAETTILVATHSPSILSAYSPKVTLVGAKREGRRTTLEDLTANALEQLDDSAAALGADRASWLQVARGLVLVEGEHDVAVIEHFYGTELLALRVVLVPIRGHKNLAGTVISEFFGGMGTPIRVVLDDVRAAATNGDDSAVLSSSEERVVRQLIHQRERFPQLDVVAYEDPDVICAIPMSAVRRVWPTARHLSWEEIATSWRGLTTLRGFKSYAIDRLGLKIDADEFVRSALASTSPGERPSPALSGAMAIVLESLH